MRRFISTGLHVNLTPWRRQSALLILLFHVLVAGLGPVADARLHARDAAAHATLHVESEGNPACSPGHSHDHCLVCRTFQPFTGTSDIGARLPAPVETHLALSPSTRTVPRILASTSPLGPRAPPQV